MKETSKSSIEKVHRSQKEFFATHQTKEVSFRLNNLKKFKSAVENYEDRILEALHKDLRKSGEEAYFSEISLVLKELEYHIKNLKKWSEPQKVSTPSHLLPSSGRIQYEPLGIALIIAPWNYPFQLLMDPLVGAISAGCCVILKPSEFTPHTAEVVEELIRETFPDNYIALVQGGPEVGEFLLKQRYDMIFFTGSTRVGGIVKKAAAEYLTPVILELGGKSPCIVDHNADLDKAAKRILFGKTINAGQTCVAPDYLLVHQSVKEELIQKMKEILKEMFGENIRESKHYARIVNEKSYNGLVELLEKTKGKVRTGGSYDREDLFIEPVILDEIDAEDATMEKEIFGPILPVMTYSGIEEAISYINSREKPLALYYFGKKKTSGNVLQHTSSGGVCINDTLMHVAHHHLPFGGVGNSGHGKYHGKESFLAFSNKRAVLSTPTWIDVSFRNAPYKYFGLVKKLFL